MGFESILFGEMQQKISECMPDFFHDLQLDYLLGLIKNYSKIYSIEPFYFTLPEDPSLISYRQQVYADVLRKPLADALSRFCLSMQKSRGAYEFSDQCEDRRAAASYHLEAASHYWDALLALEVAFEKCEPESRGFMEFRGFLLGYLKDCRADGWERDMEEAGRFFSELRFSLIMEEERVTILEETEEQPDLLREIAEILREDVRESDGDMPDLFPGQTELSTLEETLVRLLARSRPSLFQDIDSFYSRRRNFYSECILRFEQEIQFYLSFYKFQERTETLGYTFGLPKLREDGQFSGTGLYDLALAWRSASRNYEVVDNDFRYPEKAAFFVVTGPNQGGKTTFARSMGQALYFSMMGLPVNAKTFHFPFFHGIVTHFEAEEKIQSNSGKLKEEISRLAPIVHQDKRNLFVILNELFTTATTYDAALMGKRVVDYFLNRGCFGIYVTHIQELADEREGIVSLVAQVEAGEEKRRTYRILPMEAQGCGYSEPLVRQFELRYEDIIRRLS